MGFIAYQVMGEADRPQRVRILLECQQASGGGTDAADAANDEPISYSYAVDVQFVPNPSGVPGQSSCTLHGIEELLALKKFYKLVFSLEERAREHGNDRQQVFASAEQLVEHLDYTRNARRLAATARVERREPPSLAASYREHLNLNQRNFTGI